VLGRLGDVLVEPTRRRAGDEDALDRVVLDLVCTAATG
jgi:hypothetical protein